MNQPIEGFRDEPKVDGRTAAGRAQRAGLRSGEGERAEVRPETRSDSVRAAEIRAQEILDALDGSGGAGGELDIPANLAPAGWEYQLKAASVAGQENRHHMLGLMRSGWTPVPASRHPHLMPAGHDGPIEIKGLMLMEKPKILTDKARDTEKREAMDQLRNSESRLNETPANTAPREEFPDRLRKLNREMMRPVGGGE